MCDVCRRAGIADLEPVVDQVRERQRDGEQAGLDVLQRDTVVADERDDHLDRMRAEGPDDGVVAVLVGAQNAMRVVVRRRPAGGRRSAGSGARCVLASWFGLGVMLVHLRYAAALHVVGFCRYLSGMLRTWATACAGSMRT